MTELLGVYALRVPVLNCCTSHQVDHRNGTKLSAVLAASPGVGTPQVLMAFL